MIIKRNAVKELAVRYNVTQQEIANYLHVDVAKLRRMTAGKQDFKETEMHQIVAYFNQFGDRKYTLDTIFECTEIKDE